MNWFDNTHPDYDFNVEKWVYSRDHYEARVLWEDYIDTYLIKRSQGETDDGYNERKSLADYTPFFAYVTESIVGRMFAVSDKNVRQWQGEQVQGLGDPKEPGTPAFIMSNNADGLGTNWEVFWKQASIDTPVYSRLWFVVDPKTDTRKQPAVRILNPLDVPDWYEPDGHLTQVKVSDNDFIRDGIFELSENDEQYLVYELDGWTRYRKRYVQATDEKTGRDITKEIVEEVNSGAYYFEDRNGDQMLPIFYVDLPLRRNSGYILSKKNNVIFNKESDRDWLERTSNYQKLVHYADDDEFAQAAKRLSEGSNFIQGDKDASHRTEYISPDSAPATINRESLQQKIEHFLYVASKEYSDSAKEKTATERRLDDAEGVGAFLELLSSTIDEAENRVLWLLEQCYFPAKVVSLNESGDLVTQTELSSNRQYWGQAFVERTKDFQPVDMAQMVKEIKETYFGIDAIPANTEAKLQAAQTINEFYSIQADEDELRNAIESGTSAGVQQTDVDDELARLGL